MVKTGVFKKIFALTAAITLISSFAVGVSAAPSITTTTTYNANDNSLMNVAVTVDGIENASAENPVQVTYYATDSSATGTNGVVYIDQNEVTSGTQTTFNFVAGTEFLQSNVKVAQTGDTAPTTGVIAGREIKLGSQSEYIPTEATTATVTFGYQPTLLYTVDDVNVRSGSATVSSSEFTDNVLTVSLTNISGNDAVELGVKEKPVKYSSSGELVDAAIIAPGESWDEYYASGNRVITVLGKISNAGLGLEYGVIISATSFENLANQEVSMTDLTNAASVGVYKAQGKSDKDYFAVMLVDEEDSNSENAVIKADGTYYVAVYCQTSAASSTEAAKYKVSAQKTISVTSN